MHLLEPRAHPSQLMKWLSPLIAIALMLITGSLLFLALDKNPIEAFKVFFIDPLTSSYGWGELLIKASPLILIAQGLAIGFRARIFNIGAEGQLIMGALFGRGDRDHVSGHDRMVDSALDGHWWCNRWCIMGRPACTS